jgi:3-dehydroquinate dehydratase type I
METSPHSLVKPKIPNKTRLVGVIASPADLSAALAGGLAAIDLCELRLDLLGDFAAEVRRQTDIFSLPIIITVRDPAEGGAVTLSSRQRITLFRDWLPVSDFVDIEARNLSVLCEVRAEALALKKTVIVSSHFMEGVPAISELESTLHSLRSSENWIFKIACKIEHWRELRDLGDFQLAHADQPIALVGMGRLGKLARLVFSALGSELTYVSLGDSVASGQWEAGGFRALLDRLTS